MNQPFRKALLLTITLLSLPALSQAGGLRKPKITPREPFKPPYDVISAVDATAMTITISHVNSTNTGTKTFKVDNTTEVQVNGEKGTFADVKTGMKASVAPAMDESKASRLVVGPVPIQPAAPAAAAAPKKFSRK